MMEKMIFGRYVPANSIMHQMDPRAKLLLVFFFVCVVFLANNVLTYALLGLFTIGSLLFLNIPFRFLIRWFETGFLNYYFYVCSSYFIYKRRRTAL